MLTYTHRVVQEFMKLVDERMKLATDALTEGTSLPLEELRRYQGTFQGLRDAKTLLEDAISIVEGRDRG